MAKAEVYVHSKGAKSMFWGIALVIIGLIIVLNVTFGLSIPILRVLLGAFFIYLGVKFIIGPQFTVNTWRTGKVEHQAGRIIFSQGKTAPNDLKDLKDQEFNVIFGSGELDLTEMQFTKPNYKLEINTVFGDSQIYIPTHLRLRPKVSSVLGSVELPKEEATGASGPVLEVSINSVFGSTVIQRR